jgi:hypothetical protein
MFEDHPEWRRSCFRSFNLRKGFPETFRFRRFIGETELIAGEAATMV